MGTKWTAKHAIDIIKKYNEFTRGYPGDYMTPEQDYEYNCAKNWVAHLIAVDGYELVEKRFVKRIPCGDRWTCSKCNNTINTEDIYCSKCGSTLIRGDNNG